MITPLVWQQWERELEGHPDKEWVQFLVRGIQQGFRVGHDQSVGELRRCRGNMSSAREQRAVIQEYLDEEVEAGRIWRVSLEEEAKVHCSPFGVIPKKGKPGRWRLIVDLSTPDGGSVTDGVSKEGSNLHYMSVDHVVEQVLKVGRGASTSRGAINSVEEETGAVGALRIGRLWGSFGGTVNASASEGLSAERLAGGG